MAQEAEQLGDSSYGESTITVTVPSLVQINGVDNIIFGELTADHIKNGHTQSDSVCVFSNVADHGYVVKAEGSGEDDAFTLSQVGGEGTEVPLAYEVTFGPTGNGTPINNPGDTVIGTGSESIACSSDNASFEVILSSENLEKVTAGNYSGTLTLTVSPPEEEPAG